MSKSGYDNISHWLYGAGLKQLMNLLRKICFAAEHYNVIIQGFAHGKTPEQVSEDFFSTLKNYIVTEMTKKTDAFSDDAGAKVIDVIISEIAKTHFTTLLRNTSTQKEFKSLSNLNLPNKKLPLEYKGLIQVFCSRVRMFCIPEIYRQETGENDFIFSRNIDAQYRYIIRKAAEINELDGTNYDIFDAAVNPFFLKKIENESRRENKNLHLSRETIKERLDFFRKEEIEISNSSLDNNSYTYIDGVKGADGRDFIEDLNFEQCLDKISEIHSNARQIADIIANETLTKEQKLKQTTLSRYAYDNFVKILTACILGNGVDASARRQK